jgi:uncharacterized protein (TIGR03084 family)
VPGLLDSLLEDLRQESTVIESLLAGAGASQWSAPTPAAGWTIGDQVTHLAYFDEAANLAAVDEVAFRDQANELQTHGPDFSAWVADQYRSMAPSDQHVWFQRARSQLLATFASLDSRSRLPWYGSPMSAASTVTARIMETWAHGQDIAEALHVEYRQSMRIYHVAHLGVRTFAFSFVVHGLEAPDVPVWVDLEAPDGTRWTWGDPDAPETVTGRALDFCHVTTQRRHLSESALITRGPVATQWLKLAQSFAGPPALAKPRAGGK